MTELHLPKKRTMIAPAGFGKRLLAFIIDLFIIDIALFSAFQKYFTPENLRIAITQEILPKGFIMITISLGILTLLYFSLTEYYLGSTIGMKFFRIQVAGKRTYWNCLIRNVFSIPFFPFTILWIIEPIHLIWKKERLLEQITKTQTVQTITL